MTSTKPFFWESKKYLGTVHKLSPYILVSYEFVLESFKNLNRIFWAMKHWFKVLEYQIWSTNKKRLFLENETNLGTLQKLCTYIQVSYKLVLISVKRLSRLFWAIEYSFQSIECQIWSTDTKPFLWKSKTKPGTLQKLSCNIGVSYTFVLKSVKIPNRIFWVMEHWFKALEC